MVSETEEWKREHIDADARSIKLRVPSASIVSRTEAWNAEDIDAHARSMKYPVPSPERLASDETYRSESEQKAGRYENNKT